MFLANERQSTPVHVANNDGLDEVERLIQARTNSRHQDPTTAWFGEFIETGGRD